MEKRTVGTGSTNLVGRFARRAVGTARVTAAIGGWTLLGWMSAHPAGNRVTVVDGEVSGFGENCVHLSAEARLEGLVLRHCGQNGAFVGGGSMLAWNRVSNYGQFGLRMEGPASFSNNVLAAVGYGASPGTAYTGGVSGGGNVCGGPCAPPPKRRFYLTQAIFQGANADNPGNCAAGFHFA